MPPSESGGSGGTSLTLSKRYSAAFSNDGQAASATDSLQRFSRIAAIEQEHGPKG
jgi:hypothetical protein